MAMKENDGFSKYINPSNDKGTHALLSASGAERWMGCPGSVQLTQRLIKEQGLTEETTEWAKAGTDAHTLLQFILENEFTWQKLLESPKAKKFKEAVNFTKEQLTGVRVAAQFVFGECRKIVARGEFCQMLTEEKVLLNGVGHGTADVILFSPGKELHVIDYKNGKSIVEPEHNKQLLYYGVAAAERFDWKFKTVKLTIVQPNAVHRLGQIRTWTTNKETLRFAGDEFFEAAKNTKRKNAPLVTNAKWCWFCPARQHCPEQLKLKTAAIMPRFERSLTEKDSKNEYE